MLLTSSEQQLRLSKVQTKMQEQGVQSLLLRSVPAFLYLTGSVSLGYIFIPSQGEPIIFLERPYSREPWYNLQQVHYIRKPEMMPEVLEKYGYQLSGSTATELSQIPVAEYNRLANISSDKSYACTDASTLMREVRMIKTDEEIKEIRRNAQQHMKLYQTAPTLFKRGMTDLEWQYELEHEMRRLGSIGVFRCFGWRMEIFMGNLITGKNAEAPAPYDFAMGGAGSMAMPFGANGTPIKEGQTVMVDMAGNYSEYTTDITRTFALGTPSELAMKAHRLSVELHHWFMEKVRPGVEISSIYNYCIQRVEEENLSAYFMGTDFQSKFVGHGHGLEINEPPVLTPRWKGCFQENMSIAFEPKFVIPETGAVGVENCYIITNEKAECISPLPMDIIPL